MPLKNYIRIISIVITTLIFLYIVEERNSWRPGLFVGSVEIAIEIISIYLILKSKDIGYLHTKCLLLSFLLLAIADTAYVSFFYYFSFSDQLFWTIALTTVQYALAFFFMSASLIGAIEKTELKDFFINPVSILTAVVVSTIALQFLFLPYFALIDKNGLSFLTFSQGLTIIGSFTLVYVSLLTFLSSRSLFWTIFSAGAFTLGLGDWAIRVETLLGRTVQFGFYEFFWALGVGLVSAPILIFKSTSQKISSFRVNSLLSTYKLGTLIAILTFVGFLFVSGVFSLGSLKIAVLACSLTVLLSGYVALFLLEQTERFVKDTLNVLDSCEETKNIERIAEKLPIELRSTFEIIHKEKTSQRLRDDIFKYELKLAVARSDLAKKVAHDIRSPLAALKVLTDTLNSITNEEKLILHSVTKRIHQISNDLLVQSRLETVEGTSDSLIPLFNALVSIVTEKKLEFKDKTHISISLDISPELEDVEVHVDETELHRALSNLINNAFESISTSGRVTIAARKSGNTALIEIKDSGIGLSPQQLRKIESKTQFSSKENGHGHGLTQVYNFIKSNNYNLEIATQPGKGSAFTLSLPICTNQKLLLKGFS